PGQPYGQRPGMTPPPKRGNSVVMVIAIICLACAIIAVSSFGILYLVRKNNARTVTTPTATATSAPSPSPSPSLTPSPTVTPDSGFAFCGTTCINNGFQVESPNGWQQSAPSSAAIEFNNPQQTDAYAIFKTPGATSSDAITLIKNDLTNYASNPGYTAPTSTASMNIGGESWTYETASYQLNGATEQVQIYATVHGGNAYIIELQWPALQFTTYYTGFFQPMLNSFKFQ